MKFRLSQKAEVLDQLRLLGECATKASIEPRFVNAIKQIVHHLESHPPDWGDPQYRLKHEGGVVCRGIADQILIVRFAVHEVEKSVYVLDIKPFPRSPLAQE